MRNENLISIIVFTSTFLIFIFEALIHYNIGKNQFRRFELPPIKAFMQIFMVVLIFSFIDTMLVRFINRLIN